MGPTLFVFEGKHLPHRKFLRDSDVWLESLAALLPRSSVVTS